MLLPGHLAAGYLTTNFLLYFATPALSLTEKDILMVLGTTVAILPDLDLLPHFMSQGSVKLRAHISHRGYLTHLPLLWCLAGLAISVFGSTATTIYLGLVIWLSSWSHFLCDSLGGRILWLWPFSTKGSGLFVFPEQIFDEKGTVPSYYRRLFMEHYMKHPVFWIETALILGALFLFLL